jgi:hypothetical protein
VIVPLSQPPVLEHLQPKDRQEILFFCIFVIVASQNMILIIVVENLVAAFLNNFFLNSVHQTLARARAHTHTHSPPPLSLSTKMQSGKTPQCTQIRQQISGLYKPSSEPSFLKNNKKIILTATV